MHVYYIYGVFGSSLHIESTDSMIKEYQMSISKSSGARIQQMSRKSIMKSGEEALKNSKECKMRKICRHLHNIKEPKLTASISDCCSNHIIYCVCKTKFTLLEIITNFAIHSHWQNFYPHFFSHVIYHMTWTAH